MIILPVNCEEDVVEADEGVELVWVEIEIIWEDVAEVDIVEITLFGLLEVCMLDVAGFADGKIKKTEATITNITTMTTAKTISIEMASFFLINFNPLFGNPN